MSDTKKACSSVTAVGCSVDSCTYHTQGNRCSANRINVQNEQNTASQKAETFCSTFDPKITG